MKKLIYYLIIVFTLASCHSFKEINALASSSSESLKKFKHIEYNFTINCQKKCYLRALEDKNFPSEQPKCDCNLEKQADKNFNHLIGVLVRYFDGLSKLSNDELTNFTYNDIETPLTEGKYISKGDIKPYKELARLVTKMYTDNYRAKELSVVIEEANKDIIVLLEKVKEIVGNNIIKTLDTKRSEIQQVYMDIYSDSLASNYEKYIIKEKYIKELITIDYKQAQLEKYVKSIDKIIIGHQNLYENRYNLKNKAVKKDIIDLYSNLQAVINQF